jgi:hypothetical protein
MTPSINTVADALKTLLDTTLTAQNLANAGYDYRTNPDKLNRSFMLHYISGFPNSRLAAGSTPYYDFGIVIFAQHDKTEAKLREAERDLNDIENAIYNALDNSHNTPEWLNITISYPSFRPRSPIEMPETRIGEIPFRVNLR